MPARYVIGPSIWVARLGNSEDDFYLAPDAIGALPIECDADGNVLSEPDGTPRRVRTFKAAGAVRRQAAPFRIFRIDDAHPLGEELTLAHPDGAGEANNLVVEVDAAGITVSRFSAADVGLTACPLAEIAEDATAAQDSRRLIDIMTGRERGPRRDFVALNAAALLCDGRDRDEPFPEALRGRLATVAELLDRGDSLANYTALVGDATAGRSMATAA